MALEMLNNAILSTGAITARPVDGVLGDSVLFETSGNIQLLGSSGSCITWTGRGSTNNAYRNINWISNNGTTTTMSVAPSGSQVESAIRLYCRSTNTNSGYGDFITNNTNGSAIIETTRTGTTAFIPTIDIAPTNSLRRNIMTYGTGEIFSCIDPSIGTTSPTYKPPVSERFICLGHAPVGGDSNVTDGTCVLAYTGSAATTVWQVMDFSTSGEGTRGYIGLTSSACTLVSTSDYRLKTDIDYFSDALDHLDRLNPIEFDWINEPGQPRDQGFLAHEVQEVISEAVFGEKDASDAQGKPLYQTLDSSRLIPLMVGAIKELSAKIQTVQINIETLEH